MSETIKNEMPENRETICDDDETHLSIDLSEIKRVIANNAFRETGLFFSNPSEDIRYVSALALCCPEKTVKNKITKDCTLGKNMKFGWLDKLKCGIIGFLDERIGGIKSKYRSGKNVLSLISVIRSMN